MREKVFGYCLTASVIAITLLLSFQLAIASEVTNNLKSTIDEVIKIVSNEELKKNKSLRREKIRDAIGKRFDFRQMAMRSLAKAWKERTPQEKREFIQLFKKLLEHSYASKIENYSDEEVSYTDEKVLKGKFALVKTEILRKEGKVQVDYKLIKDKEGWQVYDFIIEEVSMIRNYRSQFNKIIRKESYEGLVKKLASKISEIESDNHNPNSEKL